MRKKFLALSLAVIVSAAQVMTVSASKQEQLQQQQAAQAETSAQLDNAKAEIDDLETKKNQITGEIDDLDAQLVVTMASVENLKNEIAEKQTEIRQKSIHHKSNRTADARYGSMPVPAECIPDEFRPGDSAPARGASLQKCRESGRVPEKPPEGSMG